jgi:hypothetical protein
MTLRNAIIACALALTVAGLILVALGRAPGVQLAIGAGIFTILMFAERWRYGHVHTGESAPGFEATDERYRDPATGEWMAVEFNPKTGARRYVKVGNPPASPK